MTHKSISFMAAAFLLVLFLGAAPVSAQDCEAAGDVNNDGIVLTVTDYVYLARYVSGEDLELPVPYQADLNGDCMIDYLDVEVYASFFDSGITVFGPYGGYPVPTCCDPDLTIGACCFDTACLRLNPANCQTLGGDYHGDDTFCDQNPGDANSDGAINVGDAVYLINYLQKGGSAPNPAANGDVNGDCAVDMEDVVYLVCLLQEKQIFPVACTCPDPAMGDTRICMPGDANGDSTVNVADAVYLIGFVFNSGSQPVPFAVLSGDGNGDGHVNVGDAVYIINYVFNSGSSPVQCGPWIVSNQCLHPDGYWLQ